MRWAGKRVRSASARCFAAALLRCTCCCTTVRDVPVACTTACTLTMRSFGGTAHDTICAKFTNAAAAGQSSSPPKCTVVGSLQSRNTPSQGADKSITRSKKDNDCARCSAAAHHGAMGGRHCALQRHAPNRVRGRRRPSCHALLQRAPQSMRPLSVPARPGAAARLWPMEAPKKKSLRRDDLTPASPSTPSRWTPARSRA